MCIVDITFVTKNNDTSKYTNGNPIPPSASSRVETAATGESSSDSSVCCGCDVSNGRHDFGASPISPLSVSTVKSNRSSLSCESFSSAQQDVSIRSSRYNSSDTSSHSASTVRPSHLRRKHASRRSHVSRMPISDFRYRTYLSRNEEEAQIVARDKLVWKKRMSLSGRSGSVSSVTLQSDSNERIGGMTLPQHQQISAQGSDANMPSMIPSSTTTSTTGDGGNNTFFPNISSVRKQQGFSSCCEPSRIQSFSQAFLFERYHSIPGFFAFIVACIAHSSLHDSISGVLTGLFLNFHNWGVVYLGTFFLGVMVLRLFGGCATWLCDQRYEGFKFDMHNKLRLGHVDARLLRWTQKKLPSLGRFVNIVSFYFCFLAVSYFVEEKWLPAVCNIRNAIKAELPSRHYENVRTEAIQLVLSDDPREQITTENVDGTLATTMQLWQCMQQSMCCSLEPSFNDLRARLEEDDEAFLYSKLSMFSFYQLLGRPETSLSSFSCSFSFHVVHAVTSILILAKIGVDFDLL